MDEVQELLNEITYEATKHFREYKDGVDPYVFFIIKRPGKKLNCVPVECGEAIGNKKNAGLFPGFVQLLWDDLKTKIATDSKLLAVTMVATGHAAHHIVPADSSIQNTIAKMPLPAEDPEGKRVIIINTCYENSFSFRWIPILEIHDTVEFAEPIEIAKGDAMVVCPASSFFPKNP